MGTTGDNKFGEFVFYYVDLLTKELIWKGREIPFLFMERGVDL